MPASLTPAARSLSGMLALTVDAHHGVHALCVAAGGNTVIPDHTLQKAAIEQFLTGGLTLEAITYQVCVYAKRSPRHFATGSSLVSCRRLPTHASPAHPSPACHTAARPLATLLPPPATCQPTPQAAATAAAAAARLVAHRMMHPTDPHTTPVYVAAAAAAACRVNLFQGGERKGKHVFALFMVSHAACCAVNRHPI